MAIDKETVKHVAHLARIELGAKELIELSAQLQDIVKFIDKLKKLEIKNIPATSHILPVNNILREDNPKESLPAEKALENAPKREGDYFIVPKVIE